MSFKCNNCGYPRLTGRENDCPKCHLKITYKCYICKKELLEGPPRLCPTCKKNKELESAKKKKKLFDVLKIVVPILSALYVPAPDILTGLPFDDLIVIVLGTILTIVFFKQANKANDRIQEIENDVIA